MTLEELSDKTHNGMMNHALTSVAALFEADGWSPCDSIKAANELLEPAWNAWNTLMERVTADAQRIAALEAQLAEARKDSERLTWIESDMEKLDDGVGIYFEESLFRFPYLMKGEGGFGGGVGEKAFCGLRAAIDAAMDAK